MCGLIAAFTISSFPVDAARKALDRMARRGPDAEGEWRDDGVYLAHRRLAILDLDQRASQPMHSSCGRFVIVFNGEVYNYRDLRRECESKGMAFRTTSDTEVILALFASHGEAMLPKLHGMFAFVIWDRIAGKAFAARDPYGIKPLYVASWPGGLLLASQVKALLATGLVSQESDPDGEAGFWMLGSVPEPHTWYRDVRAIPAGHFAWIEQGKVVNSACWEDIGAIWRMAEHQCEPALELGDRVAAALRESIGRHVIADVGVGVFLSGGIDSGAVAGLMAEAGVRDLEGITVAYDEFVGRPEDEVPPAALIAKHYGIRHHVRKVTKDEFLADLPRIMSAMDQPSVDGINTWYASKAAAERGLKVVVSGIGGDELFFGYAAFRQLPGLVRWWKPLSRVPGAMVAARQIAATKARSSAKSRWAYAPDWARSIAGAWWLRRSVHSPADLETLMGAERAAPVVHRFDVGEVVSEMVGQLPHDYALALAQIESMAYLRNQILRDSDWASMDHSVELRTPLVDSHLLKQLRPVLRLFPGFRKKSLLAQAPRKPLPTEIATRRKTGFGIPIARWLASDGSPFCETGSRGWSREVVRAYEGSSS